MPLVYNSSAAQPVGSSQLNIDGLLFTVEGELSPERKTREIRRNDVNGDRADFQLRTEPSTLPVTLQRANTSVVQNGPNLGSNNVTAFGVNWVVMSCKPRQPQGDFHRFDVVLVSETVPSA